MVHDLQDCTSVGQVLHHGCELFLQTLYERMKDGTLDYDNVENAVKGTEENEKTERRSEVHRLARDFLGTHVHHSQTSHAARG